MPSVILTAVIAGLIALYAGWIIYKSIKRAITKESKSCCGGCDKCPYGKSKDIIKK